METKVLKQEAEAYYISHPQYSYAIFSIGEKGDLFINGDWGQSNFAWRSFGAEQNLIEFKKFLIGLNEDYWKGKMEYNLNYMQVKKQVIKHFVENTWPLFQLLQEELKNQLSLL